MQFRLPCPHNPQKFFFVYVVTKDKENFSKRCGGSVPCVEALYESLHIHPTACAGSPDSTLIVIKSDYALKFSFFKYMVKDIINNGLKATFSGAYYDDVFYVPASTIAARPQEILCARECVLEYLYGTTVCIYGERKERHCDRNDERNHERHQLEELAGRYGFKLHFQKHTGKKVVHEEGNDLWGAWKSCDDSWKNWNRPEGECRREYHHPHTPKCVDDECEGNGWVKEPMPTFPKKPKPQPKPPFDPDCDRCFEGNSEGHDRHRNHNLWEGYSEGHQGRHSDFHNDWHEHEGSTDWGYKESHNDWTKGNNRHREGGACYEDWNRGKNDRCHSLWEGCSEVRDHHEEGRCHDWNDGHNKRCRDDRHEGEEFLDCGNSKDRCNKEGWEDVRCESKCHPRKDRCETSCEKPCDEHRFW